MPKLKSFITPDGQLTQDDIIAQVKEMKRLADLKAKKEKSEESLKRIMNPANIKAQAQKIAEITRANDPLNVTMHERFRLKTLSFSEWLEVHSLASKTKSKSNNLLLQSLRAKFQWVLTQVKALGIPPPPELSTFGVSINDKKRKRSSEILNEVFVNKDIVVGRMHRNLVPPPGVEGRKGLVIREPESGIFFYNVNFDLVFQREEEFHLATTSQLIRLHNSIPMGSLEAEEMFAKLELTIEAREDVAKARIIVKDNLDGLGQHIRIQVKDIVKEVEDHLKTYSSAGMDISWYVEGIR
ncbi:hypothetical protein Tco_1320197 [Tanacetum coccineum]